MPTNGTPGGDDRFDSGRGAMSVDRSTLVHRLGLEGVDARRLEGVLWVGVASALVGDVVTTFVGLHLGLHESNPVARSAIEGWGLYGMLGLKGLAVGVALLCRPLLAGPYRPIIPAALAVPWLLAVVNNVVLILATVV